MTVDTEEATYGLIVSFPDQSESFVLGFEAGLFDAVLTAGLTAEHHATVHTLNLEVLRRLCVARGWSIESKPTGVAGWSEVKATKDKPAPKVANPHGLRLV